MKNQQGRSQEFAKRWGTKEGSGDGCPPAGSRGRARWGSGGEAPRSRRHMVISSYDGEETCTHAPPPPLRPENHPLRRIAHPLPASCPNGRIIEMGKEMTQ